MSLLAEIKRRYAEAICDRNRAAGEGERLEVQYQQGKLDLLREAWVLLCGSDTLHKEVSKDAP